MQTTKDATFALGDNKLEYSSNNDTNLTTQLYPPIEEVTEEVITDNHLNVQGSEDYNDQCSVEDINAGANVQVSEVYNDISEQQMQNVEITLETSECVELSACSPFVNEICVNDSEDAINIEEGTKFTIEQHDKSDTESTISNEDGKSTNNINEGDPYKDKATYLDEEECENDKNKGGGENDNFKSNIKNYLNNSEIVVNAEGAALAVEKEHHLGESTTNNRDINDTNNISEGDLCNDETNILNEEECENDKSTGGGENDNDKSNTNEVEYEVDGNIIGEGVHDKNSLSEGYVGRVFTVDTFDEMRHVIEDYMEETSNVFVVVNRSKTFGKLSSELDLLNFRVQWCEKSDSMKNPRFFEFDGIPQMTCGHYIMKCQYGEDRSQVKKSQRQQEKQAMVGDEKKKRRSQGTTKKIGCPAFIYVTHVIRFPQFKIVKDTHRNRTTASKKLKEFIKSNRNALVCEPFIVGKLPDISYHRFHSVIAEKNENRCHEQIHLSIVNLIQELYLKNTPRVDIRTAINKHVADRLFYKQELPDQSRRKYYPTRKDINNIILRLRTISELSTKDIVSIQDSIEKVRSSSGDMLIDFVYSENKVLTNHGNNKDKYNEESDVENEISDQPNCAEKKKNTSREIEAKRLSHFLFIYENSSQQRLLVKFGSILHLIEIKYTSRERSLHYSMYALIVQTNVDYQVVCCMVTSKCREAGLIKALNEFRECNNAWCPDYIVVDYSTELMHAVSEVFPDAKYFLNPSSCEKEWDEFLSTASNELLAHRDEIFVLLKSVMYARTDDNLTLAATCLESSEIWKTSHRFRKWFNDEWLTNSMKWVLAYRPEDFFLFEHFDNMFDACLVEYEKALNKSAKFQEGLPKMVEMIHEIAISQHANYKKRINDIIVDRPVLDRSREMLYSSIPLHILPYVKDTFKVFDDVQYEIHHISHGVFQLKADEELFSLSFGDATSFPFCSCPRWQIYRIPCVHMFYIFAHAPGWSFELLSPLYKYHSNMVLDYSVADISKTFINLEHIEKRSRSTRCSVPVANKCTSTIQQFPETDLKIFSKLNSSLVSENTRNEIDSLISQVENLSPVFSKSFYEKFLAELKSSSFNTNMRLRDKATNSDNLPLFLITSPNQCVTSHLNKCRPIDQRLNMVPKEKTPKISTNFLAIKMKTPSLLESNTLLELDINSTIPIIYENSTQLNSDEKPLTHQNSLKRKVDIATTEPEYRSKILKSLPQLSGQGGLQSQVFASSSTCIDQHAMLKGIIKSVERKNCDKELLVEEDIDQIEFRNTTVAL